MRPLLLLLAVVAGSAAAKPWQGIDPGTSKREDVIRKFGEPTKVVNANGKTTLAYFQERGIKGTSQVQFRIDPGGVVDRIDVFPSAVVDKDTVESTYGPACPSGKAEGNCYVKKLLDEDFRTYFLYPSLGLAIFFKEDGKTVHSFVFQPAKPAAK